MIRALAFEMFDLPQKMQDSSLSNSVDNNINKVTATTTTTIIIILI